MDGPPSDPLAGIRRLLDAEPSVESPVADSPPAGWQDTTSIHPPVEQRPMLLPLAEDAFSWGRLEAFVVDLLALIFEGCHVYRYGGTGSTQEGVDVVVERGPEVRLAAQVKQRKQFGPAEVRKAIEKTEFEARTYLIVVSKVVSSDARKVAESRPGWKLLDADDMSRLVRSLPPDQAQRLVENHFGSAWRKLFLGASGPALFLSPEEAMATLLDESRIFHHAWPLVGREEELGSLNGFRSTEKAVAIMVGPGGIGKTRLLDAVARASGPQEVRFLASAGVLTPEGLDQLPSSPLLLIVDDAHRRTDLGQLLGFVQQRRASGQALKVLIATRPRRVDELHSTLSRCGFDLTDQTVIELSRLREKDVEALATEALGDDHRRLAPQLSAASADCPLITVIGGKLIRNGQLQPALLGNDNQFRHIVLARFRDELLGNIAERLPAEEARLLLEATAAVGPIPLDDETAVRALAEFVGLEADVTVRHLDVLEQSGVMNRRGQALRVTPDLLADFILEEACVVGSRPTGYASRAYEHFRGPLPGNVLRNLAELDWRMRAAAKPVDLFGDTWKRIEQDVLAADNRARIDYLSQLEPIAYYQPKQVLAIVSRLIAEPRDEDGVELLGMRMFTHAEVLAKLPGLLQAIAYTADYTEQAVQLLWQLGRDDQTSRNGLSGESHPIRALGELAGYSRNKPVGFNDLVLSALERILEEPGAHTHAHLAVPLLGKLMAREGFDTWSRSREVVMQPFFVDPERTHRVRQKTKTLLLREAVGQDERAAHAATVELGNALRGPMGYFGAQLGDEEQDLWLPEQLELIELLETAASKNPFPALRLAVVDALEWHAELSRWKDVREKARKLLDGIEEDLPLLLAGTIREPWSLDWLPTRKQRFDEGRRNRDREELGELHRRVAAELLDDSDDPLETLAAIEEAAAALERCELRVEPGSLLWAITETKPEQGPVIARKMIDQPSLVTRGALGNLIAALRHGDPEEARLVCFEALDRDDPELSRSVARSYWTAGWLESRVEEDMEIIERLLSTEDATTRSIALQGVGTLAKADAKLAASLATGVSVGDSVEVAEALCGVFHPEMGVPPTEVTDVQLGQLLKKLVEIDSIEDYEITEFLKLAGSRIPEEVLDMLLARIERSGGLERKEHHRYEPLPHEGFGGDLVSGASPNQRVAMLERVRDSDLEAGGGFRLPRLFQIISRNFADEGVQAVAELVDAGGEEDLLRAARLLEDAPPHFVFEQKELVEQMMRKADAYGDTFVDKIVHCLERSALEAARMGPAGEPFKEDVVVRDRAVEVLAETEPGNPAARLFEDLRKQAEWRIARQSEEDDL